MSDKAVSPSPTTEAKLIPGTIAFAVAEAHRKADRLMLYVEALREIEAACELPNGTDVHVEAWYIAIHVPFNPATIRAFRRAMGARLTRQYTRASDDGDVCWNCHWRMNDGRQADVLVWLITDKAGATCRKELVGTKTEPVYRVVCEKAGQ